MNLIESMLEQTAPRSRLIALCVAIVLTALTGAAYAQAPSGLYFVHTDHLNTPRAIYNDQQQLVWKWDQQEPFGNSPPDENPSELGTFECNMRFPGQYFDKETNLAYNYFRDFDQGLGRYVQSDPVGLQGGINTYGYVSSNPLTLTDPTGESPIVAGMIIGAVAGGVGAALQGGNWTEIGVGMLVGGAGGATLGLLPGAALLARLGIAGQVILRGSAGALGNVEGQYVAGWLQGGGSIDPCSFRLNFAAVGGAAIGGAVFGTMGSVTTLSVSTMVPLRTLVSTSGATIQGAAPLGVASRVGIGAPFAVAQGSTTAAFGIFRRPTPRACSCKPD